MYFPIFSCPTKEHDDLFSCFCLIYVQKLVTPHPLPSLPLISLSLSHYSVNPLLPKTLTLLGLETVQVTTILSCLVLSCVGVGSCQVEIGHWPRWGSS